MRIIQPLLQVPFFIMVSLMLLMTSSVSAVESKKIKFGVMSLAQPARIYKQWQPFVDYVNEKTGYEIEIVVPRGFKKIKKAIAKGDVDFFYINSLVFYKLKKEGKAVALAQMQNITSRSVTSGAVFVRGDSGINTIEELKGKSFAFVSPMGVGGYLVPRAMFAQHGINTKKDLKESFTKNLSSSIHRVLLNEDQAGIMCGINYKLLSKKMDTSELKVIKFTEDFPETLIGARSNFSKKIRKNLSGIILAMSEDNNGKEVLKNMNGMKIQKFVKYDSKIEEMTEGFLKQAGMKK